MPGRIVHLKTRKELKEFITTSNAFIIDFTATWCGPCKMIAPHVNALSQKYSNIIEITPPTNII